MSNEPLFEEIFQESPVPKVILRANAPDFAVIEANKAFLKLNGRSKEDLIGKGFFDCYPLVAMSTQESITGVRRCFAKVLQEKKIVRGATQKVPQHFLKGNSPKPLYLQSVNTPTLNQKGEVTSIIRSLEDVTDMVHTQYKEQEILQVLRENDRFLKETQSAGKIGSWQIDRDYNVTWSDIHYEIFETGDDYHPTTENGLKFLKHEADKERLRGVFLKSMETGAAFDEEFEVVTAKGNTKWIRFAGKGDVKDGELLRIYGISQDITAHKTLEHELIHSRNQYLDLIQTIQGVVWEADWETHQMTFISDQVETILGYTKEECLKERSFWQNHLHPQNRDEVIKYTMTKVIEGRPFTHDYRIMKKDGSYVWLRTSFSVISENNEAVRVRGLMVDVTDKRLLTDLDNLEKTVLKLNSSPGVSLEDALKIYLEGITELFPEMHAALMRIKNGHMYNWVSTSLPAAYEQAIDGLPIGEGQGSCGTAAYRKQLVVVSDIANDPLWSNYKHVALRENLCSCWSYPIISTAGEVMATFGMYYSDIKQPSEEELKVVERTASILKVIIEQNHYAELVEEANSLMRQSQELAHFGILQWDIPADTLTWSKEMYAIFGIDPQVEVTQEAHFSLVHPQDREIARSRVAQLFASGEDQIFEERIIRPDGEVRHLKTWIRLKSDQNSNPLYMIGACIDITENKTYEERLLASERRLRNILDSQTNYVVRIGLDFRYNYTNKKFIDDFAYEGEVDLIGKEALRTVRDDQREEVKQLMLECIAQPGMIVSGELEKLSPRYPNKATFWHFVCFTDAEGNPSEVQGIGIDISERKKAEKEKEVKTRELEASERRYSDLFHLSPQPMYLFDTITLQFLDVNEAAIKQYGYSRKEFLSMTVKEIKTPESLTKLEDEMAKAKERNIGFYRSTFTHLTKSGEIIHVDLHSNLIPYKDHEARLVLASNITDRMKYLNALELQNKKLKDIAWTQSHIVRAPLARIMALIDMIKNYPDLHEENQELLTYVLSSATELDEVIRDISKKAEAVSFGK
ncbi:MAG TPA: PAS domain S-box protein [Cyclobacteriaceae bacterium]|nr:PAS domain S-box protein [Cyclobacteriaceae bacterium]